MKLPSPLEYSAAIQNPDVAFAGNPELAHAMPEMNPRRGTPTTYSGNFTATFRLQGGTGEWAVRCYTREISWVTERYNAITQFLEGGADPALTMARLVPKGIDVGGERYDIIQMEWIAGPLLNEYVSGLVKREDAAKLSELADAVLDLGLRLERLGIAHGDIQHGNVLVDTSGNLRLIDYDDMFLPELAHLRFTSGIGQENYQHPGRPSTCYDEKLDRFPFISIYVTLRALAAKPWLLDEYNGGEDWLLFRRSDFVDPHRSQLFQELDTLGAVKELVDRFASVCAGAYEDIPSLTEFIDGRFRYARYVPKAAKTRPVVPAGTRPAIFVPPPATAPVQGLSPSPNSASLQQPNRLPVFLGIAAACVIVVFALLGMLGHRSPHSVALAQSAIPVAPRSHQIARAPLPPVAIPRRIARVTSTARPTPTPQAPSTPAPQRTPAVAVQKATAAPRPAPRATEPKEAALVAQTVPKNACSTPDAPARVVSLAQPQLSDEARAAAAGKSVVVAVDVAADGSVSDASVKDSAGDVTLDFAALSVARRSTYSHAETGCTAAAGTVDMTVTY